MYQNLSRSFHSNQPLSISRGGVDLTTPRVFSMRTMLVVPSIMVFFFMAKPTFAAKPLTAPDKYTVFIQVNVRGETEVVGASLTINDREFPLDRAGRNMTVLETGVIICETKKQNYVTEREQVQLLMWSLNTLEVSLYKSITGLIDSVALKPADQQVQVLGKTTTPCQIKIQLVTRGDTSIIKELATGQTSTDTNLSFSLNIGRFDSKYQIRILAVQGDYAEEIYRHETE